MTQLCCSACRLRVAPGASAANASCPRCGQALSTRASRDAVGCSLWSVPPENIEALVRAVADVIATSSTPGQTGRPGATSR